MTDIVLQIEPKPTPVSTVEAERSIPDNALVLLKEITDCADRQHNHPASALNDLAILYAIVQQALNGAPHSSCSFPAPSPIDAI